MPKFRFADHVLARRSRDTFDWEFKSSGPWTVVKLVALSLDGHSLGPGAQSPFAKD